MNKRLTKISKYLTFVLRHEPQSIGLQLDPEGWTPVEELLQRVAANGKTVTPEQLDEIIRESDVQRFALSEDRLRIRAV
jgi:putative RNA 2'-phosphotransferase